MCLIGPLGVLAPRLVLIVLWFFYQPFVMVAFSGVWIWPLLGLFLLPITALTYCWAVALDSSITNFSELFNLAVGLLIDFGILGSGRGMLRN